ncbi:MAG: hypothetical protein II601_04180 [Lachnospiraceae bacterium]|nr:hypothetical protein [Lachnospiraceae bacterium]
MGKLKIGWSEISITPDKKVALAGQFAERISEYVEKPITATAMAVTDGEEQMTLVSCDLVSIGWNLVTAVRKNLEGNTLGIDPMKIVLNAIHTHTGPVYKNIRRSASAVGLSSNNRTLLEALLPEGSKYVESAPVSNNPDIASKEEVLNLLIERITKVILDAWSKLEDQGFVNAFGRAAVGMCRRAKYSDGTAAMWGETNTACFVSVEGGEDTGVELLYIYNEAKKLTGVVVNLACPAQAVQHRLFVSPDFWGEAKMLLRKRFGEDLYVLALCSPAGDQCPVDIVRWVEPYSDVHDPNIIRKHPLKRKADPSMFDLDGMRKAGKRIANEVAEIYEEVEEKLADGRDAIQSVVPFKHIVYDMQLPVRRVTITEYKAARKEVEDYIRNHPGNVDFNVAANLQIYLGTMRRYEEQQTFNICDTETHIMRLGTIAIGTDPFELFLDYGNQIKARSDAEQTFLIQLANGTEGYLPTEKAEQGGHYSAFVSSGVVGHQGGEQYVRETLKHIRELFSE